MKNKISLKRILIATGATATLLLVSLPLIVSAVPTAVPTGGNVDANFNTVTSSLYYDADNTGYYIDPASTTTALSIAGGINNPSANPVLFNDAQGIEITGVGNLNLFDNVYSWDGAGPIYFQSGEGVNFSNPFTGINHFRINGSGYLSNDAGAVTINDAAVITGVISNGGAGSLDINDGVDISGNISNDAGGSVTIDDPQGMVVNASDPATGIIVNNPNGGITVNASNNGGMTINSPLGGMTINSTSGGFTLNSSTGGIQLNSSSGGIVNNSGSVKIADSLNVTSSIDGDSHLFLAGTAYIDSNLDVDGNSNLKGNIYNSSSNYSGRVYVNDNMQVNGTLYTGSLYPSYINTSGGNIIAGSGDISGNLLYSSGNLQVNGSSNLIGNVYNSSSYNSGRVYVNDNFEVNGSFYADYSYPSNLYPTYMSVNSSNTGSIYGGYIRANSYMYSSGSVYGSVFYDTHNTSFRADPAATSRFWILNVDNTVTAGGFANNSDVRLKKNISKIDDSLSKVEDLKGVTFEWKDKNIEGEQLGFIAQEVEKVAPQLVTTNNEGYKMINYDGVIPLVVNAIQDLKTEKDNEIAELKAEIEDLKEIVCELKPEAVSCK